MVKKLRLSEKTKSLRETIAKSYRTNGYQHQQRVQVLMRSPSLVEEQWTTKILSEVAIISCQQLQQGIWRTNLVRIFCRLKSLSQTGKATSLSQTSSS